MVVGQNRNSVILVGLLLDNIYCCLSSVLPSEYTLTDLNTIYNIVLHCVFSSTNHSSPSSTYSASPNPRTPTPETLPTSTASRLPNAAVEERSSPIVANNIESAAPPRTLLAVRKLPFSEPDSFQSSSEDSTIKNYNSAPIYPNMMANPMKPISIANTTTQSQIPVQG